MSRDIAKGLESAKPEVQKPLGQLIVRIRNYSKKEVELSEVGKTFEGVEELTVWVWWHLVVRIEVDKPLYSRIVDAMCIKHTRFMLITGNV